MNQRTGFFLAALFALGAWLLPSCSKYPDGPGMSFRSKTERLSNNWKPELWLEDGKDITAAHTDYSVEFLFDGNFTVSVADTALDTTFTQNGLWAFQNDEEEIGLYYTTPPVYPDRAYWTILKLKEKELWVEEKVDSIRTEVHFVTK